MYQFYVGQTNFDNFNITFYKNGEVFENIDDLTLEQSVKVVNCLCQFAEDITPDDSKGEDY